MKTGDTLFSVRRRMPAGIAPQVRAACLCLAILLLYPFTAPAETGLSPVPGTPAARDFELPDTAGRAHRLQDYRGKYVLVNFWAEWCDPCVKELPSMQGAYAARQEQNFEILAVHVGRGNAESSALLERLGIGFPVLIDSELALRNWNVQALPSSYLVDPEGRLVYHGRGAIDWEGDEIRALLDRLLKGGERVVLR